VLACLAVSECRCGARQSANSNGAGNRHKCGGPAPWAWWRRAETQSASTRVVGSLEGCRTQSRETSRAMDRSSRVLCVKLLVDHNIHFSPPYQPGGYLRDGGGDILNLLSRHVLNRGRHLWGISWLVGLGLSRRRLLGLLVLFVLWAWVGWRYASLRDEVRRREGRRHSPKRRLLFVPTAPARVRCGLEGAEVCSGVEQNTTFS
jgi:hypothetical protein